MQPPVSPVRPRRWRRLLAVPGLALVALGAAAVLFLFPPDEYRLYPQCLFHAATGWDCPGCGGLRGVHQLLHGNVSAALRLNPFLPVYLVLLGAFLGGATYRNISGRPLPAWLKHPAWGWSVMVSVILFGIVRNLPPALLAQLGLGWW